MQEEKGIKERNMMFDLKKDKMKEKKKSKKKKRR